jgi:photosystem II stability/assembly factor-like uncharacterized protein
VPVSGFPIALFDDVRMTLEDGDHLLFRAGTEAGVFKTTNGAGKWGQVNSGLTNLAVSSFAIHPTVAETLYAGTAGGVFKTINGGVQWKRVNSGLRNVRVQSLAIHPNESKSVYAGTEGGVFQSGNGGNRWTPMIHILHSFGGGKNDGRAPECNDLLLVGSTFYGMTTEGGGAGGGVIFRLY